MLTVSNYHYIRENFETKFPSIFGITPKDFKIQLLKLKSIGQFISGNDLIKNGSEILKSKDNYFLITFDDGLREQFDLAMPILEDHNIPAIFFANSKNSQEKQISLVHKIHLVRSVVNEDYLLSHILSNSDVILSSQDLERSTKMYIYDNQKSAILKYLFNFKLDFREQEKFLNALFNAYFNDKEIFEKLYMSDSQLIKLSKMGFLGSHTHSHQPLGLFEDENILFELQYSKKYFENLTNTEISLVSYPYGTKAAVSENVVRIAKKCGYNYGFTTDRGNNDEFQDPLALNRYDCNDLIGGKNYKGHDK